MNLPPFLLDHWLAKYEFANPPIPYNLASSTGPKLKVSELLALGQRTSIDQVALTYAPPDGSARLRAAIAEFHGVDPDWVVVTTGASEALSILFCLMARAGAQVVLPDPQFPGFAAVASAWGLETVRYALRREDGFQQSASTVLQAVGRNCALALINTPHNPTGSIMAPLEIATLAAELARKNIPLVVDEVYHPLYFGAAAPSAAAIDNVIVVSDMSKALSLPGLRTGWLIVRDKQLRDRVVDARSYFTISSSPVLEALAVHALDNRSVVLDRLQQVTSANLTLLDSFMKNASEVLAWARPGGGTIAFPWFKDGRDARPFCERAAAKGILVAPGDCFNAPSHIRMGFGAQVEGYSHALALLSEVLGEE